jgi:hypothetical protein
MGIDRRMRVADAVLAVFEALHGGQCEGEVRSYRNGRENGYGLVLNRWDDSRGDWTADLAAQVAAIFTEARSSDDIVVYIVPSTKVIAGLTMSEEEYKLGVHFGPYEYTVAVQYIWEVLTKNGKLEKKEV